MTGGTSSTRSRLSTDLSTNVEISHNRPALSAGIFCKNSPSLAFMSLYCRRDEAGKLQYQPA